MADWHLGLPGRKGLYIVALPDKSTTTVSWEPKVNKGSMWDIVKDQRVDHLSILAWKAYPTSISENRLAQLNLPGCYACRAGLERRNKLG